MIQLNFKIYMDKLNNEKLSSRRPTEHYYEDDNRFVLLFKSRGSWEYYTIVNKSDITEFGDNTVDNEFNIDFFRMNYCSNNVEIEDIKMFGLNERVYLDLPEYDPEQIDITKNIENEIDPGEDVIEEAKTYTEFLNKTFNNFEKRTLAAVDSIKLDKAYINKGFGDFLRNMFNSVNTVAFGNQVKRFIRADLETGMVSAEEETSMDIGFTESYKQALGKLASEQINGYTVPNGQKFHGIKGVTKEIQSKVIMTVQDGLSRNKSLDEIKEDIKNDFAGFSDNRAALIGRTETNRIISSGKLIGYKETGLEGGKVWNTAHDNRTSEICRRLSNKYGDNPIPLDDPFIDDVTMQKFQHPPAHCNCRSVLSFRVL